MALCQFLLERRATMGAPLLLCHCAILITTPSATYRAADNSQVSPQRRLLLWSGRDAPRIPIARHLDPRRADPPAASCRHHIHPRAQRRHQIPIAPAAPPVPNLPRLRALALFGRRPAQPDERIVIPASKNLHKIGSQCFIRSASLATTRPLRLTSRHTGKHRAEPIELAGFSEAAR
jgi:hypothetical protein